MAANALIQALADQGIYAAIIPERRSLAGVESACAPDEFPPIRFVWPFGEIGDHP